MTKKKCHFEARSKWHFFSGPLGVIWCSLVLLFPICEDSGARVAAKLMHASAFCLHLDSLYMVVLAGFRNIYWTGSRKHTYTHIHFGIHWICYLAVPDGAALGLFKGSRPVYLICGVRTFPGLWCYKQIRGGDISMVCGSCYILAPVNAWLWWFGLGWKEAPVQTRV